MADTIPLHPTSVYGYGGMVVAPHYLSTQAGLATLERGGNAVDAAIAVNAVQGTVAPETCGIGGDLFALVHSPGDLAPVTLNASGRSGTGAAELANQLRWSGHDEIPAGHAATVTVPGCVDGWLALHGRFGRLDLSTVLEPAIRLARGGFAANGELSTAFRARINTLLEVAPEMYPGGEPPPIGVRLIRSQLANTLERIATQGRDALYGGEVGQAICSAVHGAITGEDLERSQAEWVDPLRLEVFGSTAWTIPPNSQGYISLLALAIAERLGVPPPDDPAGTHLLVEAYRLAAGDRDEILADPDRMTMAPAELISQPRIEKLADLYDPLSSRPAEPPTSGAGGTAYMCVADGVGMGVSLIQSNFNGIGSGRAVPPGGFFLHDRGAGFVLRQGHPNELAPGRRPLHTLSPTLWTNGTRLKALVGTRGGYMQPQLVVQLATELFSHGAEPASAQARPRWVVPLPSEQRHSTVEIEPGVSAAVIEALEQRGHQVIPSSEPRSDFGPASVIMRHDPGLLEGAADPRVETTGAGAR